MKDYTKTKSKIRIPSGKEEELDELLQDTELSAMIEKMCKKSGTSYLVKTASIMAGTIIVRNWWRYWPFTL